MTIIAIVPALVALLGALVYALASNPKLVELGRLAFLAGLIAFMFAVAGSTTHVRIG